MKKYHKFILFIIIIFISFFFISQLLFFDNSILNKNNKFDKQSATDPSISIDDEDNINIYFRTQKDYDKDYWGAGYTKLDNDGNYIINPKIIDKKNYRTLLDRNNSEVYISLGEPEERDYGEYSSPYWDKFYYSRFNNNENYIIKEKIVYINLSQLIDPTCEYIELFPEYMFIDSDNQIIIFFHSSCAGGEQFGHRKWIHNNYFIKINLNGDTIIPFTRITNETYPSGADISRFNVDKNENIHILSEINYKIFYMKLNRFGNILQNKVLFSELNNSLIVMEKYILKLNDTEYFLFGDFEYFSSPGCVIDSENNIHLIYSEWDSCGGKDAYLYHKIVDGNGNNISQIKITTHYESNKYDHGPAIFGINCEIDSMDNIHIVWYINDGSNYFEVYYMKIDNNGNILKEKMRIYISNNDNITQNIEIILTIILLIIIFLLISITLFKRKKKKIESGIQRTEHKRVKTK